jgi:hypothetical protein
MRAHNSQSSGICISHMKLRQKLHSKDGFEFVISCNHFTILESSTASEQGLDSTLEELKILGNLQKDWIVNLPAANRSLAASATEGSVSLKRSKHCRIPGPLQLEDFQRRKNAMGLNVESYFPFPIAHHRMYCKCAPLVCKSKKQQTVSKAGPEKVLKVLEDLLRSQALSIIAFSGKTVEPNAFSSNI